MNIAEKLTTIAENQENVYKAGQSSMVDESKIIEKTVSGTNVVVIDDTSEIPHDVGCKVESVNLLSNFLSPDNNDTNGITYTVNVDGTIVANGTATADSTFVFCRKNLVGTYTLSGCINGSKPTYYMGLGASNYCDVGYGTSRTYDTETAVNIFIRVAKGATVENVVFKPKLEKGSAATDYTPYVDVSNIAVMRYGESAADNLETYTVNADGTVDGIKSLCPVMTLSTDVDGVRLTADYHKSWGKQAEHDAFWDSFQRNGTRTGYNYAFRNWTFDMFKPKYDIKPQGNCNWMWGYFNLNISGGCDIAQRLEDCGVTLDTSGVTEFGEWMNYTGITHMPKISTVGASALSIMFYSNSLLHTIDEFVLKDDGSQTMATDIFTNCNSLKNIKIVGKIGASVKFAQSPLSKASIISVVNALWDGASGKTLTLKTSAVTNAFGSTDSDEWKNLIATKSNWTITLV